MTTTSGRCRATISTASSPLWLESTRASASVKPLRKARHNLAVAVHDQDRRHLRPPALLAFSPPTASVEIVQPRITGSSRPDPGHLLWGSNAQNDWRGFSVRKKARRPTATLHPRDGQGEPSGACPRRRRRRGQTVGDRAGSHTSADRAPSICCPPAGWAPPSGPAGHCSPCRNSVRSPSGSGSCPAR